MTSESVDKFFTWLPVINTTEERSQQNSISDDDPHANKIRESTKKINDFLKTSRLKLYSSYVKKKKNILSKIRKNSDVFNVTAFSDSEFKTYYDSFKEIRPENSIIVHDDLFVWSYVEKQGMKNESVDAQKESIWEPAIDISTDDHHGKHNNENQCNRSYKAAGALLIKKHESQKKNTPIQYNTRSASKNSVKNNTSCPDVSTETPATATKKVNDSDTKGIRNKKLKNAKRNLRSAIDNVSSQVSEASETNLSCDFIPEDFQAHSTQIFSDTFTEANVPKSIKSKKACRFSSNDANNQPRDSGIEEDSRDENTAQENIDNLKGKKPLKKSDKKTHNDSTESCNTPRKKNVYVKIIGDETITRKYKIISKNTSPLQAVVEEKRTVTLSELNNKNDRSKLESNNDSENDLKSEESGDEEESNSEEKAKESSDEYYDVHDDNNALSSEDEKVSLPEENEVKIESAKTNEDNDSQDSRHRRRRINNELQKCASPWLAKQYNDLKRLRLLESSQDDSEFELDEKNKSGTITKQKVSVKSKETSKNITNEIEKVSNKSNKNNGKKKSFVNGMLIDSNSEMNGPQVTNSDIDQKSIKNLNNKEDSMMRNSSLSTGKEDSTENGDISNSKLDSDSREYSKSDTTGSLKSLQKNKKLKHKKKRKNKTTTSVSSRENSCERQTQHDPKDVKAHKHSLQLKDKTKSDYNESRDSEEDVDVVSSKNNSPSKYSSDLSTNDIVKSKQTEKNDLKNEIFSSSDDEKESEEKKRSENQKKKLQNVKKTNSKASIESNDSEAEREKADLQNQTLHQENEGTSENILKESDESADEFDGQEMKETILPHQENQNNESDEDDEGLPTQVQENLQKMKRLTFDDRSESEDSDADTVSMHKHKSQFVKAESVHEASSDEERDDKAATKLHLQRMKNMDLMASEESVDSETEYNNADLQRKKESSRRKNGRTMEKDTGKSNELGDRESSKKSDESDEEDEVSPTQHAQKKLQKMKRLKLDGSSESEDSETEKVVINIHRPQVTRSEIAKEQNVHEKSKKERAAGSDESSEEEEIMSEIQKRKLQKCKKMNLVASDESSASEAEHEHAHSRNEKELSCRKNGETSEKNTEKSHESDDTRGNGKETKETTVPRLENQSDESDKEDEVLPTQHAQEKLQQMKRLDFDGSSESEDSETETALKSKHKTQVIKSQVPNGKNDERADRKSSERESDEEDTMSEHQKNHLQKMRKMNLVASDESEDSDKEDQIAKSKRRKLSGGKVKSDDSEDDDKSDTALEEKLKLNKSRNGNSSADSDSDSVHYDSDNIDVKEHKVIIPEDLKNSNLLEQFAESNTASSDLSRIGGQFESLFDRKEENKVDINEDEEIDNMVPAEVSKRMQQLKRLNLYENSDSSDSDESLKNNRSTTIVSQKSNNVPRKERDDSSSDEKESIPEEPTTSKINVNESEVNDTKEEIEDNIANDKDVEKAKEETNKNVIIPETQESEDLVADNNQSQEMFSSLENLADNSSQNPVIPERETIKPSKKITEMAELVEQEELVKSALEPAMTLDDIDSEDDEIFVIQVPKNAFDAELIGKKLVITKSTVSIGDSHYETVKKDASPVMSCVLNSKRKKYKTVNVRPLRSIVAQRKKDADDYIENAEIDDRQKNQRSARESDQESINEARDVEPSTTKKTKKNNRKLSHTEEAAGPSSIKLEGNKVSKKKSAMANEIDPHDFIPAVNSSKENTQHGEARISKTLKRKLYASDHEIKDVDSNVTDDSLVDKNSFKKPKNSKKMTDTSDPSAKPVEKKIRKKLALKNLNKEDEIASVPKNENNEEVAITEQSQSKSEAKKKSNKVATQQEPKEECQSEKIINTLEDNKEMFENMFRESFLVNVSTVEDELPVKKKAQKRKNVTLAVNSESKAKKKKKSQLTEVEEGADAVAKPKRTRKKVEKPKEEPASVQIMKLINDAFKSNGEMLNTSTSSNESRYGALDIERVSAKKKYSSSSSSDEGEQKYARLKFQIRDKSKEKDLPGPPTCDTKQEVKDEKKKIKKIVFDE